MDLSKEIIFKTMRSGGRGGQHVNKVETAVLAALAIEPSTLFTAEQKQAIRDKLGARINAEGILQVKSQAFRSQLENKADALAKINRLISSALQKKKPRIATKASRASAEKRLESKKKAGLLKAARKKYRGPQ